MDRPPAFEAVVEVILAAEQPQMRPTSPASALSEPLGKAPMTARIMSPFRERPMVEVLSAESARSFIKSLRQLEKEKFMAVVAKALAQKAA